jgi:3-oxoacyl-[acyl-carrier protein] reductase
MSILLTGSRGSIGGNIKKCLSKKYDIIELDIKSNPSVDATDEKCVRKYLLEISKTRKIKYIINCIGIPDAVPLVSKSLLDIDIDNFKRMVDINLNAVFIIIKECYRLFNNDLNHIVNISSMYSSVSPRIDLYNGKIKNPAYTASKHGLIGLSKHLAVILSSNNIKVNCIAPGGVTETINDNNFIEKYNKQVPLKTTIPVKEIINTIKYLFKMETITGQNIIIDGGYTII